MVCIRRLEVMPANMLEAMNRLLEMLMEERFEKPFVIEDILDCLTDGYCSVFIAENSAKQEPERFVGMGFIYFKKISPHWSAEIHNLAVDETYRGRGIGAKIVEALIKEAREFAKLKGACFPLSLTSRPKRKAHNFYRKLGFELRAKAHGKNGTNLYRMTITS